MSIPFVLPYITPEEYLLHDKPYSRLLKKLYLDPAIQPEEGFRPRTDFEDFEFKVYSKSRKIRDKFIAKFGFSVYSKESLDLLATFLQGRGSCVDVGAGTGYLTRALVKRGVICHAMDKGGSSFSRYGLKRTIHRDFEIDVSLMSLQDYPTVLMSWPEQVGPMSKTVIDKMHSGQMLVYIGESQGGCTACDEFFDAVYDSTQWLYWKKLSDHLNMTHFNFLGLHDQFEVYEKL